jgi:hypothetical protein
VADNLANIASLATAGGTLVLAVATFFSTRSANQAARVAERALMVGLRPLLVSSRLQDPEQKVRFVDGRWIRVAGGFAAAEISDSAVYLVISLRNVGSGMAVLHGWTFDRGEDERVTREHHTLEDFHRLTRDLYVPPGELGFWQGALRDPFSAEFKTARAAIESQDRIEIQLLYGDHEGGQRVITMISLNRVEDGRYISSTARHWNLDRSDPR